VASVIGRGAASDILRTKNHSCRSISPLLLVGAFSKLECQSIKRIGDSLNLVSGEMAMPVEGYRNSLIAFIRPSSETDWLAAKLLSLANKVNEHYGFDVIAETLSMQYTRYEAGGKIGWHDDYDCASANPRKISMTVQLSEATDYDGGALEFFPSGELPFSRCIGTTILFPSFLMHQVDTVTRGLRESLVAWFAGSNFR
jgi:PKHD-type hydroxylase